MLKIFVIFAIGLGMLAACTSVAQSNSNSKPISHEQWTSLLQKHVSNQGMVNYEGFVKDMPKLEAYLDLLRSHHPNKRNWSDAETIAYWINAYNAFTVKLIADNYPVASIKDIRKGIPKVNSVWDIKFIEIEGMEYDLNNIEHGILRKDFEEPRIHFAVNCASVSCPVLLNEAFTAENLESQLERQARAFVNDPVRNRISQKSVEISKIFSWFKSDFTRSGTIVEFLNQYSEIPIAHNASVRHLDYDWNLNE